MADSLDIDASAAKAATTEIKLPKPPLTPSVEVIDRCTNCDGEGAMPKTGAMCPECSLGVRRRQVPLTDLKKFL